MATTIVFYNGNEKRKEIFEVYGYYKGSLSRCINDILNEWIQLNAEEKNKIKDKYDKLYTGDKKVTRK